jgi:hypothetical protein
VKEMKLLLNDYSQLYEEYKDNKNNVPNDNRLTTLVLELYELKYTFTQNDYHLLNNQFTYNERDVTGANFLFNSEHPDHKKLIKIVFDNIILRDYSIYYLLSISAHNNYGWLDSLLARNYIFTTKTMNYILKISNRRRHNCDIKLYINDKIEKTDELNNSAITYLVWKLNSSEKIQEILFNKIINYIKTIPPLDLYYFDLVVSCIKHCPKINYMCYELLIITIFNNIIQEPSNNCKIYDIICKKYLNYTYLSKLVIDNIYKEEFVEILLNKNIFKNNINLLFDCVIKYNYIVTIDFVNKLLLKTEICKGLINTKSCNINIQFNIDSGDLIQITNNSKINSDKIYVVDLFDVIPNDDTFKIALNKGYTDTVIKLINNHKFIINSTTLNEAMKSKNIDLITYILQHGIVPTKDNLYNLITIPDNKNVIYNDKLHNRYKIRRRRRLISNKYRRNKNSKINNIKIQKQSNIINIVELLITYGLNIDLDCVSLLLSVSEDLLNLERFNIEYDEGLYFICYVNDHYPKEYMEKFIMDKNILKMRRHTYNESINTITNLFKTINVTFDMYVLDRIMSLNNRLFMVLTKNNNCYPCIATMYKLSLCQKIYDRVKYRYNCKLFRQFVDKNNITKDMMCKQFNIVF